MLALLEPYTVVQVWNSVFPQRQVNMYIHKVFTVHLVNEGPAATVCRQPQDLCPSACERRWPVARRPVSQDSLLVGPKISKTSDLCDVYEYL